jgi:aminoglycoside phosphotransferase (APT) family kinase protein
MVEELPDSTARELMYREGLARVPGYRQGDPSIEISRLSGGSINRSYSVHTPAGRFVLRHSPVPDAWLAADRSAERRLHRIASEAGIAPRIVHADDRWLVTEYVAGRLWMEPDFGNPERLARLGATLRRLHDLPPPECGRFDLLGALTGYSQRLGAESSEAAALLAEYLNRAAEAWRICGADERPLAILHHDLHGSNLIENTHGLLLIDWECAAVSDPLLDVACILSYHESARPYASLLLRNAGLEGVTSRQLAASVWLFDLHIYLWYRERRMRISATDAERAAEYQLSVRLPRTLEDWLATGAVGLESAH